MRFPSSISSLSPPRQETLPRDQAHNDIHSATLQWTTKGVAPGSKFQTASRRSGASSGSRCAQRSGAVRSARPRPVDQVFREGEPAPGGTLIHRDLHLMQVYPVILPPLITARARSIMGQESDTPGSSILKAARFFKSLYINMVADTGSFVGRPWEDGGKFSGAVPVPKSPFVAQFFSLLGSQPSPHFYIRILPMTAAKQTTTNTHLKHTTMKTSSNFEASDPDDLNQDVHASNSSQESSEPDTPEEATDTVGPEDVDIHGKLAHLNALNLSELTLAMRYVMITLMSSAYTDELGRLMHSSGSYPTLPALSTKQAQVAIDSLIKDGWIEIWEHGGSTCWEVAGAYAFKPGLKWHLHQRSKINRQKKEEAAKRRQRKKDADEGVPFAYEDDGKGLADGGVVHEKLLTKRGNLVPNRPEFFMNSKVPQRKGKPKYYMLVNQPSSSEGCILKLLPSFDPAEDLGPLAAVIRFYLLMDCDDYGRVRVDVEKLHSQLGSAITKRVSKEIIKKEIQRMERLGHLKLFKKRQGLFGYLRDSAQHKMASMRYDRSIPRLYTDRDFTYDSDKYKAFFKACREHSAKRDKIYLRSFTERGDVNVVLQYASQAAKDFLEEYEQAIRKEPFCNLTPMQVCGFEDAPVQVPYYGHDFQFLHGVRSGLSSLWMERLYNSDPEMFDGTSGEQKRHQILTHLIGMTPRVYIKMLKAQEAASAEAANTDPSDWDEDEGPPVVPPDEDIPPVVP